MRSQARRRQEDDGHPPEQAALGRGAGISNHALARMLARTPEATVEQGQPATADPVKAAKDWFDRAQQAYLAKSFIQAAEYFRKAFAHLPDKPDLIYNEGAALEMARHFPAAANAYEHYLILAPGAPEAEQLIRKIRAWRRGAADPDALMDPEETPAQAPDVTATGDKGGNEWNERGLLAAKLGEYARAYDCFVKSYDLNRDPMAVRNQGAMLDQLGNREAAVQAFERYLALWPGASDAETVRKRIKRLREEDFKPW